MASGRRRAAAGGPALNPPGSILHRSAPLCPRPRCSGGTGPCSVPTSPSLAGLAMARRQEGASPIYNRSCFPPPRSPAGSRSWPPQGPACPLLSASSIFRARRILPSKIPGLVETQMLPGLWFSGKWSRQQAQHTRLLSPFGNSSLPLPTPHPEYFCASSLIHLQSGLS